MLPEQELVEALARIEELEAERDKLREKADYSYEDTTRLAELRALAQAVVDDATETEFMTEAGMIKFSVADIRLIDALAALLA